MGSQLGAHQPAQFGVHGGQHLGQHLHLADLQAPQGQTVGHLQTHVAGPHDQGAGRGALLQGPLQGEGVAHGVQQVHPVGWAQSVGSVQPGDGRSDRQGAGAHHQPVIGQSLLAAVGVAQPDPMVGHVDAGHRGVQPEAHAGGLQIGVAAVGQVAPVGHLPGDVVGDAADGEVRVGVGHHHRHLHGGVELSGSQGGRDAGVGSADGDNVHGCPHLSLWAVVAIPTGRPGRRWSDRAIRSSRWVAGSTTSAGDGWGTTTVAASAGVTSG